MARRGDGPEDLRYLAYTNDPAILRRLVEEVQSRTGKSLGEIVDTIFEDCYTEEDFSALAVKWAAAINPAWTSEDLKAWAMKRRGLIR